MKKILTVLVLGLFSGITHSQVDIDAKTLINQGSSFLGKNNLADTAKNQAMGAVESKLQGGLSGLLSNTEVTVSGVREGKPSIGIITVKPLYESSDLKDTVFGQFSFFSSDGRQTVNAGVGYRQLSANKKMLFGVNGFLDQEFPYNHQRSSVGLELRSSVFEINANNYFSVSDWKTGKDGVQERALGGADLEVGLTLPYMPGAKIYRKYYVWNAFDGVADIKGDTTSLELNGDVLFPGLRLEVGINDVRGGQKSEYAKFTYRYLPGYKGLSNLFSEHAYQFKSMEDRRLDKVRRTNTIVKQTSGNFTVEIN